MWKEHRGFRAATAKPTRHDDASRAGPESDDDERGHTVMSVKIGAGGALTHG